MSELKQVTIISDAGATIQRLNEHGAKNELVFSKDFVTRKTNHGTTIGLKPQFKHAFDGANYRGTLDPTSSYTTNDFIRVTSGSNMFLVNGTQYTASIGTWICVVPVPAANYTSSNQNEMRQAGVNYCPLSPESSSLANPWATDGTANGRYWEQIGATGGTSGGNLNFRFEYDPSAHYARFDMVTFSTGGGNNQGTFVCGIATGSISNIAPIFPPPSRSGANIGFGAGVNIWFPIGLGVLTTTNCFGGSNQVDYLQGNPAS